LDPRHNPTFPSSKIGQNRTWGVGSLSKIGRPIILQLLPLFYEFLNFSYSKKKEKIQVVDDNFNKNFMATSFIIATCEI
jgi:hypothetical protein